jgi:hypothetical protein
MMPIMTAEKEKKGAEVLIRKRNLEFLETP